MFAAITASGERTCVAWFRVTRQSWLFAEREPAGSLDLTLLRDTRCSLAHRPAILREKEMFRRGGFGLTAPRFLTFVVSLVVALAALASLYTRLPIVGTFVNAHRVGVALAAYVILMLGVLLRGL
jgi:hypothetical protein